VVACIGFSAISILGYALSFLLNVTFPVWSFSFLLAFGLSGVLFTQTILQVIIAWYKEGLSSSNPGSSKKKVMDAFGSDARAHTRSVISGKPQLHQILSDPEQAARFEEHLGREFGVESLVSLFVGVTKRYELTNSFFPHSTVLLSRRSKVGKGVQ